MTLDVRSSSSVFFVSRYDVNQDRKLDLEELKVMMEKLKVPQTHLGKSAGPFHLTTRHLS